MSKKCVVIYSGGMDSTVILHHCIKQYSEVYCLTYDYNQRHRLEIDRAVNYITDLRLQSNTPSIFHNVVDLSFYATLASSSALTNNDIAVPKTKDVIGEAQTTAYVPNRNMVMLSIAVGYAESVNAEDVFYGAALADDTSGYWDCTKEFLNKYNSIIGLNRKNLIKVEAPLIEMTKKEIIEYGFKLGVQFQKTLTCYNGGEVACGQCPSCSARLKGFIDAKRQDPVPYKVEVDWKKYGCII